MNGRPTVSARTVRLVARKELLEALRDKRTLFVAMVLPVLLYPLVMLGVAPIVSMQRQKLRDAMQPVVVTGAGRDTVRTLIFEPSAPEDGADAPDALLLEIVESDDPAADLEAGEIALWIEAGEGFEDAVTGQGTGQLVVHRDSSDDTSLAAYRKWRDGVTSAEERLLEQRLVDHGLDPGFRNPIETEAVDVATAERRGAYVLGKMLSLILVVMTLSSSFYPAVDIVAGEKERGTMETLLVAPCGRAELVLGKFVAVMIVTLAAAVLNLTSMGLTMGPLVGSLGVPGLQGLSVSGMALVGILLLLVPLSGLFSAVSLALSTLARSVKEAQHYLTPMFLLVMPLAMVVVIPNIPLTPTLAAVPITNAVLFFRDLMLGKAELLTAVIVLLSTVVFAGLALWVSVLLFLREETLFRGPEGTGSLISRPRPRQTPRAASVVFVYATCLALVWYAQPILGTKGMTFNVLATQLGVVLAPCVVLAWWMRIDWRKTFQIGRPLTMPALLAIPIGLTVPITNAALQRFLFGTRISEGPFRQFEEIFTSFVEAQSPLFLVALLALLPALVEEFVFRGFILSGLRSSFSGSRAVGRAVIATAALFAVFHLFPEKWLPTFLTGLVLGLLAVQARSIWPAFLAHALNNALLVVAGKFGDDFPLRAALDHEAPGYTLWVGGSSVVLAACLAALLMRRRAGIAGT